MIENMIEPCCYQRQLDALYEMAAKEGIDVNFFTNSDTDICTILPFFARKVPGSVIHVVIPRLLHSTVDTVAKLLRETYNKNGEEKPLVEHVSILCQGGLAPYVKSTLGDFSGRVTYCEDNVGFRCISITNGTDKHAVLQGSINQQRGEAMQMMHFSLSAKSYEMCAQWLRSCVKVNQIKNFFS